MPNLSDPQADPQAEPKTMPPSQDVRFMNGAVRADQPVRSARGYRAGIDAVLLAQSVPVQSGQSVLELGVGSGVVLKCLHYHQPQARYTGIDHHPDMVVLARRNCAGHGSIDIIDMDVDALPTGWHLSFDHVIANPPFFDDLDAVRMSDAKARSFVAGDAKLHHWCAAMLKALKPRGRGVMIYRADGLDHLLRHLGPQAGEIEILPVHPFADAPANLVIVRFRKGVKTPCKIWPALVLHDRNAPQKYTKRAAQVLNGVQALFRAQK